MQHELTATQSKVTATQDELNDYDMVWAVTQGTLNAQLQWMFTKLTPPNQASISHVTFGDLDNDGFHVDANVGVPSIQIAEGNDSTVYLYIPFSSGTLQHYGIGADRNSIYSIDLSPDPNNQSTTTWMLCFKVDLNITDITGTLQSDWCKVQQPPLNMHPETFQKLCNFVSSDFTVSQIFLDLQNVDMVTYLANQSTIPTTVKGTKTTGSTTTPITSDPNAGIYLTAAMPTYFQHLDAGSNPYILGYTANAAFNDVSAFQPTGTVYSTHYYQPAGSNPADPDLSTFNFLLVAHHKTPPTTNLGFNYDLVDETGISGTGRVANLTVVNDWLANMSLPGGCVVGTIAGALGIPMSNMTYDATNHQWTGSNTQLLQDEKIAWITAKVSATNTLTIQFSASQTDSSGHTGPGLAVSGSVAVSFDLDEFPCKGTYTLTQPFTMAIVMLPGVGSNNNATVTLSTSAVTQGNRTERSSLSGACKIPGIEQAIEAIMESLLKSPFSEIENLELTHFSDNVSNAMSQLSSQIILPAPSVFAYKDVSFNDEFDLVADFNYSTQNQ